MDRYYSVPAVYAASTSDKSYSVPVVYANSPSKSPSRLSPVEMEKIIHPWEALYYTTQIESQIQHINIPDHLHT
jgi:hypothetical protein